ncbi:MAG: DUF4396 domain-containing protein [Rhizomicrobium sp.]
MSKQNGACGALNDGSKRGPLTPTFWFVMSMALLAGFIVAYPINWWLVAKGLKHGMSTAGDHAPGHGAGKAALAHSAPSARQSVSVNEIALMAAISIIAIALAYTVMGVVEANMEMRPITLPSS